MDADNLLGSQWDATELIFEGDETLARAVRDVVQASTEGYTSLRNSGAALDTMDYVTTAARDLQDSVDDFKSVMYKFIVNNVVMNSSSYANQCASEYCDVNKPKSHLSRVVECITIVGGQWSALSIVIKVLWQGVAKCFKYSDKCPTTEEYKTLPDADASQTEIGDSADLGKNDKGVEMSFSALGDSAKKLDNLV